MLLLGHDIRVGAHGVGTAHGDTGDETRRLLLLRLRLLSMAATTAAAELQMSCCRSDVSCLRSLLVSVQVRLGKGAGGCSRISDPPLNSFVDRRWYGLVPSLPRRPRESRPPAVRQSGFGSSSSSGGGRSCFAGVECECGCRSRLQQVSQMKFAVQVLE